MSMAVVLISWSKIILSRPESELSVESRLPIPDDVMGSLGEVGGVGDIASNLYFRSCTVCGEPATAGIDCVSVCLCVCVCLCVFVWVLDWSTVGWL